MITAAKLQTRTAKDLAAMAKRKGISGWHVMRKEELVKALVKCVKRQEKSAKRTPSPVHSNGKVLPASKKVLPASKIAKASSGANGHSKPKVKPPRCEKRLDEIKARLVQSKDLAYCCNANGHGPKKDRLVVMVRGPYWLHAYWELTRPTIERTRVALGQNWYAAKPVLRLCEVTSDGVTNTVRRLVRDIEIHGGVNNWYVDVRDPPKSYQLDIGYLASDGKFLSLVRSNVVTTPQSGALESFDGNWAEVAKDSDRIYAMSGGYSERGAKSELKELFEERLHRPMGSPVMTRFGLGAQSGGAFKRGFGFDVDAELIVYGVTDPSAQVTLKGEPVKLHPDGTFSVRFNLPDRRQVLPVTASSRDGTEQRTIVLAVERNTKVMEPVIREPDE